MRIDGGLRAMPELHAPRSRATMLTGPALPALDCAPTELPRVPPLESKGSGGIAAMTIGSSRLERRRASGEGHEGTPLLTQPAPDLPVAEVLEVPLEIDGRRTPVAMHVFRPPTPGPHPAVVFAHGRGPDGRPASLREPVPPQHAQFWLDRGFAVVAPMRPGYGRRGNPEDGMETVSSCCASEERWNPGVSARQAGDVMTQALQWARSQPWVDERKLLLAGHSLGGMASLDAASRGLRGVMGVVNFAGGVGRAVSPQRWAPDLLAERCHALGRKVRVPTLWISTSNDRISDIATSRRLFGEFTRGTPASRNASLCEVAAVGDEQADGHGTLLTAGQSLWEGAVTSFVTGLVPAMPRDAKSPER
jgi:dienelactone hydrolase